MSVRRAVSIMFSQNMVSEKLNLLAPIIVPMWKIWPDISDSEAVACEECALNCISLMKES
jgi:hypothetical protein